VQNLQRQRVLYRSLRFPFKISAHRYVSLTDSGMLYVQGERKMHEMMGSLSAMFADL